jgi:hypothetical protein
MAGDWIKMRRGLRHDPKVIAIARELSKRQDFMAWWSDNDSVTRHESVTPCVTLRRVTVVTFSNIVRVTVCALLDVWASLNNTLGEDGKAPFMCLQDIDGIAEIPGFGEAMESVGWVVELEDKSLIFPNFSENNSPSKTREDNPKTGAERAKEYRERKKAQGEQSAPVTPSRNVTTEKRREEKRVQPPTPPVTGGGRSGFKTDEWADDFPTSTAQAMTELTTKINALHPGWKKRPHLTRNEMEDLKANSAAWLAVDADDWSLLFAYLDAVIPETWKADPRDFIQPDNRLGAIRMGPTTLLGFADRWKSKCKDKGIAVNLQPFPPAP